MGSRPAWLLPLLAAFVFVVLGEGTTKEFFSLQPLPYAYNALEPVIDQETMILHHDKHHQAYTDKFNKAINEVLAMGYDLQSLQASRPSAEQVLKELNNLPLSDLDLLATIHNNGGGYINHNMFWEVMRPGCGKDRPSGSLATAIELHFGSFVNFKHQFTTAAQKVFGSGWAFLSFVPRALHTPTQQAELVVHSVPNQDSPVLMGYVPLLCLDVWEHAYYLKYQNRRPEYITNWWSLVNWDVVGSAYEAAIKSNNSAHEGSAVAGEKRRVL